MNVHGQRLDVLIKVGGQSRDGVCLPQRVGTIRKYHCSEGNNEDCGKPRIRPEQAMQER